MFNPLIISITYFLVLLFLFAVTYCAGHFVLKIFRFNEQDNFWSSFFFKTLTGATLIVVAGSLIFTKGKTINFVFLIITAFIFFERYLSKRNSVYRTVQIARMPFQFFNLKNVLSLFFLIFMVFLWQASIVLKCGAFPVDIIEKDSFFYAEISKCLVNTGWENTFTASNLVNPNYNFPTPYHYYDMWLNGIICRLFNLNQSLSLYLIDYSFFSVAVLAGFLSIIESFGPAKHIHKVLALLLLFVSGLYISDKIFHLYQYSVEMEGIMERYGGKLVPAYCFTLVVMILFAVNKNIKTALIILLCLPIIFISLAPAVYSGLLLFCICKIVRKNEDKKYFIRLIFYTLIVMSLIGTFYFLTKKNDLNYRLDKPLMSYTDLYSFSFFRIKFYLVELFLKCYAQPFLFALDYLPFALILFYALIRKRTAPYLRTLSVLFGFIWLGGLLAANTLYLMDDANQLFTNTFVFWHALFAFSFIVFLFAEKNQSMVKYVLLTLVFSTLVFNSWQSWFSFEKIDYYDPKVSEKYLIEVNKACAELGQGTKGATFYDSSFYANLQISYPLEYYCVPFILSPNVYVPFNLTSVKEVPEINKYQIEKSVSKSSFNQYLLAEENASPPKNKLDIQIDFIKKNNITYLVCPKELTLDFSKYFKVKTQIIDSLTGQRFIVLD